MDNLRKVTIVAVLGALILGAVLGTVLLSSTKEDRVMDLTNDEIVTNAGIPAIDAVLPEITETATFALG